MYIAHQFMSIRQFWMNTHTVAHQHLMQSHWADTSPNANLLKNARLIRFEARVEAERYCLEAYPQVIITRLTPRMSEANKSRRLRVDTYEVYESDLLL